MNIYDIEVKDRNGENVKLEEYKGKVLLIVNTATGCGYTPQYTGLQNLYNKYKDKGFEILDFPCNQFANQSPLDDEENYTFCTGRFGINFKQFSKIDVNGKNESPLYTFLKNNSGGILGKRIKWNFTKFLVSKDGVVINRYAPAVKPEDIENDIVKQLNK